MKKEIKDVKIRPIKNYNVTGEHIIVNEHLRWKYSPTGIYSKYYYKIPSGGGGI